MACNGKEVMAVVVLSLLVAAACVGATGRDQEGNCRRLCVKGCMRGGLASAADVMVCANQCAGGCAKPIYTLPVERPGGI